MRHCLGLRPRPGKRTIANRGSTRSRHARRWNSGAASFSREPRRQATTWGHTPAPTRQHTAHAAHHLLEATPFLFFHHLGHLLVLLEQAVQILNLVPEPWVIRRFREPLRLSGLRRSAGVMELMMVSMTLNWLPILACWIIWPMLPMPGNFSIIAHRPPILCICCSLSRKSSRSKRRPL